MADKGESPSTLNSALEEIYHRAEDPKGKNAVTIHTGGEKALAGNPLISLTQEELREFGRKFVEDAAHKIPNDKENITAFELGAMLTGLDTKDDPSSIPEVRGNSALLEALRRESSFGDSWSYFPPKMKYIIFACGFAAATQGWNETAVNGANIFYQDAFGLRYRRTLYGFVNAAPYASCALFTYWSTNLFNWVGKGRRGAIAWTLVISFVACFIQSFSVNWPMMLIFRLLLGVGMGPKSALVPMYSAETAPTPIRGTIVMLWQVCTAVGITLGLLCGMVFFDAGGASDPVCTAKDSTKQTLLSMKCSLHWRLMVGSPIVVPLIGLALLKFCPESPRWYIKNMGPSRKEAFESLCELRETKTQAARDLFKMHCLLYLERKVQKQDSFLEIFRFGRNRRAITASGLVMFLQQLCGINVLVYYSSEVLDHAINNKRKALAASVGIGVFNVVFAAPAFLRGGIDKYGRRTLLLLTFPFMSVFMLWISQALRAKNVDTQTGLVLTGMYLFTAFYSFGEGPVPFTYNAECHALHIRERGMAVAVSITWLFNFGLSLTWPKMSASMGAEGAFLWYMAWNIVGFFLVLFFVPETKRKSLEELDKVFRNHTMTLKQAMDKTSTFISKLIHGQVSHSAGGVEDRSQASGSPEPIGETGTPRPGSAGEALGASRTNLALEGEPIPSR